MTLDESLAESNAPKQIKKELALLEVEYFSFESRIKKGHLVVHQDVQEELRKIFKELLEIKFPINKIIPISFYGWDDQKSMEDNNSSAFNYRTIVGADRLSNHSYGKAIDINPKQNPYTRKDVIEPKGATRDTKNPGTFTEEGKAVLAFTKRGWTWGGTWTSLKDWHHFEKP